MLSVHSAHAMIPAIILTENLKFLANANDRYCTTAADMIGLITMVQQTYAHYLYLSRFNIAVMKRLATASVAAISRIKRGILTIMKA